MNIEADPSHTPGDRVLRARSLAALGDPTRLGILDLLAAQDLSPDALSTELGVPGNLLSHHLNVLERAGLIERVTSKNDGRRTYVQAVESALDGLLPAPHGIHAARVLFVCTHNSARSVLAEALWQQASDIPSASAGTHPADAINPGARTAATRHGLKLTSTGPRSIDEVLRPDDLVVSVCDSVNEELGPIDNPRLHWSIPDPAAIGTDAAFTAAVAVLHERVSQLAPRVSRPRSPRRRKDHR